MIRPKVFKFTWNNPKAAIFESFFVFSMKIVITFFNFLLPKIQSEWNKAAESFDDEIDNSFPKWQIKKISKILGIKKVKPRVNSEKSDACQYKAHD